MTRNTRIVTLTLAAAIAATGLIALAGDLNPPAGPVAPTHKTLTEVEPRIAINATNTPGDADSLFKITQPGSYYLTSNITGVGFKHGIEITSSGVTLDLMGFDLKGMPGSLDGVSVTVIGVTNITIRNGSVRDWGAKGVDLGSVAAFAVFNSAVIDVRASGNSGSGIFTGFGCTISGCTAYDNNPTGITATNGCTISGCTAYSNAFFGISTEGSCTISGCTASNNTISGIVASDACTISNCTATGNTNDGIFVSDSCLVLGNTCSFNGNGGAGRGIHVAGSDNRIEGNNCTNNDWGIGVFAAGNFIARNTCSGNTTANWDIATGNVCFVVNAATSGPISGNSGGVSPGSSDPNANFTY